MQEINFKLKGMRMDVDESMPNIEHAYYIKNMSFSDTADSNRSVLCSEQGSKECVISGEYLGVPEIVYGYCVVTNTLIIIGSTNTEEQEELDIIVSYDLTDPFCFDSKVIFKGNLNIPINSNVQTVGIDEGNGVKKVYWVDGHNQIRLVNTTKTYTNADYLDIMPPISSGDVLSYNIDRNNSGVFKAGVIQYAMSYSFKNGQETSIANITDIITLSESDRGSKPNDYVGNAIELTVSNVNTNYDKINLYSIYRSTLNSTPEIKFLTQLTVKEPKIEEIHFYDETNFKGSVNNIFIQTSPEEEFVPIQAFRASGGSATKETFTFTNTKRDFKVSTIEGIFSFFEASDVVINVGSGLDIYNACSIEALRGGMSEEFFFTKNTLSYIDTGDIGETLDSTYLFSLMGDTFSSKMLQHKDGVLFSGNLETTRLQLPNIQIGEESLVQEIQNTVNISNVEALHVKKQESGGFYNYQINTKKAVARDAIFKYGEHYRLGVVFQHKSGKMSEVVYLSDHKNTIPIHTDPINYNNAFLYGGFKGYLNPDIVTALEAAGYTRAIPVACYPGIHDRLVVAQGIVNPTIFIGKQRADEGNYAQASWNMRPIPWYKNPDKETLATLRGTPAEDSHYYPCNSKKEDLDSKPSTLEFQSSNEDVSLAARGFDDKGESLEVYYVDSNTVTFHTPDFESSTELDSIALNNLDFRIIGFSPVMAHQGKYTMEVSPYDTHNIKIDSIVYGMDNNVTTGYFDTGSQAYSIQPRGCISAAPVLHYVYRPSGSVWETQTNLFVYPFQCEGSSFNAKDEDKGKGAISNKTLATIGYSSYTKYLKESDIIDASLGITTPSKYFIENYNTGLILDDIPHRGKSNLYYNGAVDTITMGKPYYISNSLGDSWSLLPWSRFEKPTIGIGKEAAPMQVSYKTNKHLVFSFNYKDANTPVILPSLKDASTLLEEDTVPYFENSGYWGTFNIDMLGGGPANTEALLTSYIGSPGDYMNDDSIPEKLIHSVHLLGELYRKNVAKPFGGTSESALLNNKYYKAGEAVPLKGFNDPLVLFWTKGDTYYTRYDALKTLPYAEDNINKIVNITSVMCESRVNLDYRYDRNRGEKDVTAISLDNFNLINPVYNQQDNFISYYVEDPYMSKINAFPTDVVWSGVKINNSEIDAWTKFNMATSYTLDLDKGPLTGMARYNNELFALQETGLSRLIYNPRVQIPMSDGVPIEISNSSKMEGAVYISDTIGCHSIKSILTTPNGIYFHSANTHSIYLLNSEGVKNISYFGGMDGFFNDNNTFDSYCSDYTNPWCLYYDFVSNDVFINNKYNSLVFNEKSSSFLSFYDYHDVPFISNIEDYLISVREGKMYALREGDTNSQYLDYIGNQEIELAVNDGNRLTKTFNSIEFESETDTEDSYYTKLDNFTDISIRNNYQKGAMPIKPMKYISSNLKKKLCINRLLLPRETGTRNRIVSSSSYIKLERKNKENKGRIIIDNIKVKYF